MSQSPRKKQIEQTKEKVENNVEEAVEHVQQEVERNRTPWYLAIKRTEILAAACLMLFVLFGLLAVYVHTHPVLAVDVAISQEFQEQRAPWLLNFMIFISLLGNYPLVFAPLIVLTAGVFWIANSRLEALYILILSGVSRILNSSLKLLINRPRPTASLVEIFQGATGKSFPSGHVMSYVAYWGLLFALCFILFKRDRWWHYALLIISACFVVLVGPSRIYLGDHWASDVLGAYMVAGLLLGISLWVYLALKRRGILSQ